MLHPMNNHGWLICLLLSLQLTAQTELTVMHSTDLHAHTHNWLKMASCIKEQRRKLGEKLILLDCGDSIQGTPEGWLSKGKVALPFLNQLSYDAWIRGNHELYFCVT